LIKAAVSGVVVQIKEESTGCVEQWAYGIGLFDELTWSQRLVLLERVTTYLLTDTSESLELTAVNEAAVAVLFSHVLIEIDCEIDADQPNSRWREMVLAAYSLCFPNDAAGTDDEEDFALPTSDCDDRDKWSDLVESLMDRILWDRDFEMEAQFLDTPPEKGAILKNFMGIDQEYYSDAAPDAVSDDAAEQFFQRIENLTSV